MVLPIISIVFRVLEGQDDAYWNCVNLQICWESFVGHILIEDDVRNVTCPFLSPNSSELNGFANSAIASRADIAVRKEIENKIFKNAARARSELDGVWGASFAFPQSLWYVTSKLSVPRRLLWGFVLPGSGLGFPWKPASHLLWGKIGRIGIFWLLCERRCLDRYGWLGSREEC